MIYLHEIVQSAAISPAARPRVVRETIQFIPVMIALYRTGETEPYTHVPATGWAIHPHGNERGEFVIGCVVPRVPLVDLADLDLPEPGVTEAEPAEVLKPFDGCTPFQWDGKQARSKVESNGSSE